MFRLRTPRTRWLTAVAVALLIVGFGGSPAGAETTPTETQTVDLGDLDASGSGTFDAFDPALGTLTAVELTADVTMNFSVCATNRSTDSDSLPAGSVSGSAPITFPADVVANATGSMDVPETELAPFDQVDDCATWADGGPEPSSGDSVLFTESDLSSFSETVTDPTLLAEFIGPGTVPFSFEASSASNISQPSAWTIVFLADGAGELSLTYTFNTEPEVLPEVEEEEEPEVLGTSSERSELPRTGSDDRALWLAAAGGWLVLCGGALTGVSRFRAARSPH